MRKTFKKYFIPHKENDHKPHILRTRAALTLLSVLLVSELFFLAGAGVFSNYDNYLALILSGVLVDETNVNRVSQNLSSLNVNPLLEEAAKQKAEDMAHMSYFSHVGPDGKTPWEWLRETGYNYRYAGENLAVNFVDSKDVVVAWMASPGHRANILNEHYTEIGIGTATGTYKGRETIFIAQYFGQPLFVIQPSSKSIIPPPPTPSPAPKSQPTPQPLPKESQRVAGTKIEPQEELFVATENMDAKGNQFAITNAGSSLPVRYSSVLERTLASPRRTIAYLLIALATIISLALALKIFIRIEIQHPPLIVNGVLLLILITSALVINNYIGFVSAKIL